MPMAETRVRSSVGVGLNILEQYIADCLGSVPRRKLQPHPYQRLAIYLDYRPLPINGICSLLSRILGCLSTFSPELSAEMMIE
jgi:hypothetical protein